MFEERTEGGISRFAAVFHSTDADPVFPCAPPGSPTSRSASSVPAAVRQLGGNRIVMDTVHAANLVPVGHEDLGNAYYYRVPDRRAPHNLATSTPML